MTSLTVSVVLDASAVTAYLTRGPDAQNVAEALTQVAQSRTLAVIPAASLTAVAAAHFDEPALASLLEMSFITVDALTPRVALAAGKLAAEHEPVNGEMAAAWLLALRLDAALLTRHGDALRTYLKRADDGSDLIMDV